MLLAICSRLPNNEVIAAECQHLTGGIPDASGVAFCKTLKFIPQAAYVHTGLRLICEADTLEKLTDQIGHLDFPADSFRIEFQRLSNLNPVRRQEAILAIAEALPTYPDLENPKHRFLLVARAEGFWFGEIVAETEYSYHDHDQKPYHMSSSLPARLARAMVNLAYPIKNILDPCCGSGSILLEACTLGITAYGIDKSPKMVSMSRKNLAHFGFDADVKRGDARQCIRTVDAVVTDLPYGRFCHADSEEIRSILKKAAQLAPLGIFVTESDISAWLQEAGYESIETWRVHKRANMVRIIYRARK